MQSSANTGPSLSDLISKYLKSECEFDSFPLELRQQSFKLCIFELLPDLWVADENHFMQAAFTREAMNEFKRLHGH
jgi:hypothetical protein